METVLAVISHDAFSFALTGGWARTAFGRAQALVRSAAQVVRDPQVEVNLMLDKAHNNDPFFQRITRTFHRQATRPHRALPVVPAMYFGVALCEVGKEAGWYFNAIEASGRRNVRKAVKLGYTFRRIDYNAHLDDITAIHRSSTVRQGKSMPSDLMAPAPSVSNPVSQDAAHDYPYFGVFKDDTLVAYLSCLVAGELCAIETLFGHAAHLEDGVVPLVMTSAVHAVCDSHPLVRVINYGTFYGASPSLQRFKRKFLFLPHRVKWRLQ